MALASGLAGFAAVPARAQDSPLPPEPAFGANGDDLVIELGGGARIRPAYEGSGEYIVQPAPLVDLKFLRLPGLFTIGGDDGKGFFVGPSFRIVPKRDSDDYDEIDGLHDIDTAVELGASAGYEWDRFRVFGTLRQGFGGHSGLVGAVGLDVFMAPTPRLALTLGPRLNLADEDYFDEYFAVSGAEAARSGFDPFDPENGLKGVEVEAEARYAVTPKWSVVGSASYERLLEDAAASPVTEAGDENQFTAALGLTYRFGLDLFD